MTILERAVRNTPYNRRRWIDFSVYMVTTLTLILAGAGWWGYLTLPFAAWNYYDGQTRDGLKDE